MMNDIDVKFERRETGWWWVMGNFYDGPFDTQQDAFLDCQAFYNYELDELTEIPEERDALEIRIRGSEK